MLNGLSAAIQIVMNRQASSMETPTPADISEFLFHRVIEAM